MIKTADEDLDALGEYQDDQEYEGDKRATFAKRGAVGDICRIDMLGLAGAAEKDVRDEDGNPS